MFGLGNLFGGLGNLFSMPNLLSALDVLGGGLNMYQQIDSMLNQPKMPDFPRLDQQGNRPQGMPDPAAALSPQQQAMRFASARSAMAERGISSGGAFNNPLQSVPGLFGDAGTLYGNFGGSQALPYQEEFGSPYGDF